MKYRDPWKVIKEKRAHPSRFRRRSDGRNTNATRENRIVYIYTMAEFFVLFSRFEKQTASVLKTSPINGSMT